MITVPGRSQAVLTLIVATLLISRRLKPVSGRCSAYLCGLLMHGSCSQCSGKVHGLWAARWHGTILHITVLQPA